MHLLACIVRVFFVYCTYVCCTSVERGLGVLWACLWCVCCICVGHLLFVCCAMSASFVYMLGCFVLLCIRVGLVLCFYSATELPLLCVYCACVEQLFSVCCPSVERILRICCASVVHVFWFCYKCVVRVYCASAVRGRVFCASCPSLGPRCATVVGLLWHCFASVGMFFACFLFCASVLGLLCVYCPICLGVCRLLCMCSMC